MKSKFVDDQNKHQVCWRKKHIGSKQLGTQSKKQKDWILPKNLWDKGLWLEIRERTENSLKAYIEYAGIQKHSGVHNLKSSWVLAANLYFAFRNDPEILGEFLANHVDNRIVELIDLQLEWSGEGSLCPSVLLGEPEGTRGAGQTSPDVAFLVRLKNGGSGIVLTEIKFTEHSFYPCTGRKKKYGIPNPKKCLKASAILGDAQNHCYLASWEQSTGRKNRRYWEYIKISKEGRNQLEYCPAAVAGYQLFRQQAYAEAIARSGVYELVISCVAYDERNEALQRSLRTSGIKDFTKDWGSLFKGQVEFKTFTHQDWVGWVSDSERTEQWGEWLAWVNERYGFA